MDFNYVEEKEINGVLTTVVKDVKNFKLKDIFDCGQCFRWNDTGNNTYIGVAFGRVIEVELIDKDLYIYNSSEEDFKNIWLEYFDLNRDYSSLKEILAEDELLKSAVEFGDGIRILKQDPLELIISFIISANNRIPMIKRAVDRISEAYGEKVIYKDKEYYTFPSLENLTKATDEELSTFGLGFRAKYIYKTVDQLNDSNLIGEMLEASDDDCHKLLQTLSGVGPKVADCIMLFSMQKYTAFPVDVWVKRAMQHFYLAPDVTLPKIRIFAREKFGPLAGFAQQYFFYYARENKIRID